MICCDIFFCSYKNELLLVYGQDLLQEAKDRYHNCGSKEEADEYYIKNKELFKENASKYRNLSDERKRSKKRIWKE